MRPSAKNSLLEKCLLADAALMCNNIIKVCVLKGGDRLTKNTARESRDLALLALNLAEEKKLRDLVLLEVGKVSIIADYFLIATGNTAIQLHAACDHILDGLKEAGYLPLRIEGYREGWWILIDFGSLVIHLFQPEARDFYNLERLWAKAPLITVPAGERGRKTAGNE